MCSNTLEVWDITQIRSSWTYVVGHYRRGRVKCQSRFYTRSDTTESPDRPCRGLVLHMLLPNQETRPPDQYRRHACGTWCFKNGSVSILTSKICVALFVVIVTGSISRKKRSVWSNKWSLKRICFTHVKLVKELDADDFCNFMRMDEECFMELLGMVKPFIDKKNTATREAVSAEERLVVTLRYLPTGRSRRDLNVAGSTVVDPCDRVMDGVDEGVEDFNKGKSRDGVTDADVVHEAPMYPVKFRVCCAISAQRIVGQIVSHQTVDTAVYRRMFLELFEQADNVECKEIEEEFANRWNFSHAVGAGIGKHVDIIKPAGSGSLQCKIRVHVCACWCKYMGFRRCYPPKHCFLQEILKKKTNEVNRLLPHYLERIASFPILSRARRVVENAFGILASRFRVFHNTISLSVEKDVIIILACCVLHTFLLKKNTLYVANSSFGQEETESCAFHPGEWWNTPPLVSLSQWNIRKRYDDGKEVRQIFTDYFSNEGSVSFQENMEDCSDKWPQTGWPACKLGKQRYTRYDPAEQSGGEVGSCMVRQTQPPDRRVRQFSSHNCSAHDSTVGFVPTVGLSCRSDEDDGEGAQLAAVGGRAVAEAPCATLLLIVDRRCRPPAQAACVGDFLPHRPGPLVVPSPARVAMTTINNVVRQQQALRQNNKCKESHNKHADKNEQEGVRGTSGSSSSTRSSDRRESRQRTCRPHLLGLREGGSMTVQEAVRRVAGHVLNRPRPEESIAEQDRAPWAGPFLSSATADPLSGLLAALPQPSTSNHYR
ncbi:hypothetical protein PR048_016450 [Dryococelus australis]|uniref:DDE Tnp4 domain-containing protein n=1 Tax=Dryococelus australis TaxID=614101 RepID=A0ABQ9HJR2_9NEOP|nr:hypothetical protein PR048_016450 [Dryococelus australis]